jgi:hypothetical protein
LGFPLFFDPKKVWWSPCISTISDLENVWWSLGIFYDFKPREQLAARSIFFDFWARKHLVTSRRLLKLPIQKTHGNYPTFFTISNLKNAWQPLGIF